MLAPAPPLQAKGKPILIKAFLPMLYRGDLLRRGMLFAPSPKPVNPAIVVLLPSFHQLGPPRRPSRLPYLSLFENIRQPSFPVAHAPSLNPAELRAPVNRSAPRPVDNRLHEHRDLGRLGIPNLSSVPIRLDICAFVPPSLLTLPSTSPPPRARVSTPARSASTPLSLDPPLTH